MIIRSISCCWGCILPLIGYMKENADLKIQFSLILLLNSVYDHKDFTGCQGLRYHMLEYMIEIVISKIQISLI